MRVPSKRKAVGSNPAEGILFTVTYIFLRLTLSYIIFGLWRLHSKYLILAALLVSNLIERSVSLEQTHFMIRIIFSKIFPGSSEQICYIVLRI